MNINKADEFGTKFSLCLFLSNLGTELQQKKIHHKIVYNKWRYYRMCTLADVFFWTRRLDGYVYPPPRMKSPRRVET